MTTVDRPARPAVQPAYRRSPGERRSGGQPIELALQSGAYGGRMVARRDGRVVFVQGGMPGETVRAELTIEKKNFAEARATRLLAPAVDRAVPPCVYFGENGHSRGALPSGSDLPGARGVCGGCQYQHLDYDAQLRLKEEIVAGLVRRQAHLPDAVLMPIVGAPTPWRYRNRARWIIDETGRPCYRQPSSERLVDVDHCHIVQPIIEDVLRHLSAEDWRLPLRTLVSEVTARSARPWTKADDDALAETDEASETAGPEVLLALHARPGASRRDLRYLASELGTAIPALGGVVLAPPAPSVASHPASATSAVPSHTTPQTAARGLWGASYFDARFAGYRFHLAPLTFFQVNEPAAELLVARVVELLGDLDGRSVLDVYAGAGTFTLPLATRAEQVLALENDPAAVEDAQRSARANDLANVHVLPGDAEAELSGLPRRAAESAVLDPPRAGLAESVIAELDRIQVPRIVYVSCDPATLARDLARFGARGYTVESVQPFDLFPQTFHVESVALLTR